MTQTGLEIESLVFGICLGFEFCYLGFYWALPGIVDLYSEPEF
jgi:hypothetical protein